MPFAISQERKCMEQLRRVQIGEVKYPVIITLSVLEKIQENYGSLHQFEMDIVGLDYHLDANGHQVLDKNGKPEMVTKEPSIKAIHTAIVPMINEGLEIESEMTGIGYQPVSEQQIDREYNVDYMYLARIIQEEFGKCFAVKK